MQLEILFQTSPTLLTVYFSFCPLGGAMGLFFPPKQALFPAATFCLLTSNPCTLHRDTLNCLRSWNFVITLLVICPTICCAAYAEFEIFRI